MDAQQQQSPLSNIDRYGLNWRFNFRHEQLEAEANGRLYVVAQREGTFIACVYEGSDEAGWTLEGHAKDFADLPTTMKHAEGWAEQAEWYDEELAARAAWLAWQGEHLRGLLQPMEIS